MAKRKLNTLNYNSALISQELSTMAATMAWEHYKEQVYPHQPLTGRTENHCALAFFAGIEQALGALTKLRIAAVPSELKVAIAVMRIGAKAVAKQHLEQLEESGVEVIRPQNIARN